MKHNTDATGRIQGAIARSLAGFTVASGLVLLGSGEPLRSALAQAPEAASSAALCPEPALSRVQTHTAAAGETLESIAADYGLLAPTLVGFNPETAAGNLPPGIELKIPPFNGIAVSVPEGSTWQDLANAYQVRADVLFEVNGCPQSVPERIFVPGVTWFSEVDEPAAEGDTTSDPLDGYPLAEPATITRSFGWRSDAELNELVFSSGIVLETLPATTVLAVGAGTVAYAGSHEDLGALVVINHAQGFQTRYANLGDITVSVGDRVDVGRAIATVAEADAPETDGSFLYFEVRTNSDLGWIARDPGRYIPELAIR